MALHDETYERMLEEIEEQLTHADSLRVRQADLIALLGEVSTHKKFLGKPGRHPLRRTVERKLLLAVAADFLDSLDSGPLVIQSPDGRQVIQDHGDQSNEAPTGSFSAVASVSGKTLPKRRRAVVRAWRDTPEDLQLLYGQLALVSQQDALAFSLNFGTDLLCHRT